MIDAVPEAYDADADWTADAGSASGRKMQCAGDTERDEKTRARQKALVLLADMDRTEKQLMQKLRRTGFSEEAAADALEYVRGYGYIDDARYARHFMETQKGKKSFRRIAFDLRNRGVPSGEIDAVMEEAAGLDQTDTVRYLAEKKMRGKDPSDPEVRQKTAAYLARKGFRASEIRRVLEPADLDS